MKSQSIYSRFILIFSLLLFSLFSCDNYKDTKPNIIIFFTDDQGYADVGAYGAQGFNTPHLDSLAKDGIRFTNFYVPATVCTPSRAALLTGKYPKRLGMHKSVLFPFSDTGIDSTETTIAELLRDNGYNTSIVGKWHLGHLEEFMPLNHGFESFYGVPYSNDMNRHYYQHNNFQSPPLPFYRDKEIILEDPDQSQLTKMYTEEVVDQIKHRDEDKPFFIYLAHSMPHLPLYASKAFKGTTELGLYGDVISELDWSMGEIVSALRSEEIYENTMIVFTSDNGPRVGSALPLRGKKAETWEGGQRVPGIITWPNRIPKNVTSNTLFTTLDLFPTLAKISESSIENQEVIDGRELSDFLLNPNDNQPEVMPFYYYGRNGNLEAIRYGKWKLHIKKTNGWNKKENGEFPVSLFNLETDPSETINLASNNPEIVEELTELVLKFEQSF